MKQKNSKGVEFEVIPRTLTPIAGTFQLVGERVGKARSGKNLKVEGIPNYPNVIIPQGLALREGEELIGTCTLQTAHYSQDAEGEPVDITRVEMVSFRSLAAQAKFNKMTNSVALEDALAKAKIAAVSTIQWDASAFTMQPTADEFA